MNKDMIKVIDGLEGQATIYRAVVFMSANGLLSRKGQLVCEIMAYANSKDQKE